MSLESPRTLTRQGVVDRRTLMLRTAMGATIAQALADPDVIEVMLNPDGTLWLDCLGQGRRMVPTVTSASDAERIIRLVAAHVGAEVHANAPIVSAELPETGERFEGLLPPVVRAPVFSIRKRARLLFDLDTYVERGMLSLAHCHYLAQAVIDRRNIVIAGATSTGKTTLANALLLRIALTGDRVIILEDTIELQCPARDCVALRTRPGVVSMADLVRSTLRLRPDRIIVGEVRGGEALDLLKAWGTGHAGGIATLHAGSAEDALIRLEQLVLESALNVPRALIAAAVDVIVFIEGRGSSRRISSVLEVHGVEADRYQVQVVPPQWEKVQ
jgi:type IV secretion system protein TrbB